MSEREAERLLAEARAYDPVPKDTVQNVAARLEQPERAASFAWALTAAAVAMSGAIVFALVDESEPAMPMPVAEMAAPTKARFVAAPTAPGETKALVAPVDASRPERRTAPAEQTGTKRTSEDPPVEREIHDPTALAAEMRDERPVLQPRIPALAPEQHRATPAGPSGVDRTKNDVVAYQPRAIRELIDVEKIENKAVAAQVRHMMTTMDRRALLARLDEMALADAEMLVFRGALRATADRCPEAVEDFDRALRMSPSAASASRAQSARAHCSK